MLRRITLFWSLSGCKSRSLMATSEISGKEEEVKSQVQESKDEPDEDKVMFKEPFAWFKNWFEKARSTPDILEPRAMCLATSTRSGEPSARFVILRGYNADGFRFFTNYSSRKGKELSENPKAALAIYWEFFNRSIRIEGTVEKLPERDSVEYFMSRSKRTQIASAFSKQSQPIVNKKALREKEKQLEEEYAECECVPKPADWGGYILKPKSIEFWTGQDDYIHDRIRFRIQEETDIIDNVLLHEGENGWVYERLQP